MIKVLIDRSTVEQALEVLERLQNAIYNIGGEHVTGLGGANDAADSAEKPMDALKAELAKPVQEPVAWMYTGIKQDGTEHGPHLVWRPEYMDSMSASKGAKATPLYTAPPQPAEPVQEPFALPCPTPKACKAHCCSGHCVPRTNHPNHMTRIPPMLCIPHRIPDCPKCMSTHTAPPQRPAEPVQEPVAIVGTQEDTWKGYGGQWAPPGPPIKTVYMLRELPEGTLLYAAPPQRPAEPVQEALTIERLRDALVASRIVPPAAVEDPDEYDDGVTLHRIEALHRRLA